MPRKATKQVTAALAALEVEKKNATPARRAASKARAKGDTAAATAAILGPFEELFCFHFARTALLIPSYTAALVHAGLELDLTGYEVHRERETKLDENGKLITVRMRRLILTPGGMTIKEDDVISAKAANLLNMPEIRERVRVLKEERAAAIKVSAEEIAADLDTVYHHAMALGQTQVAAATRGMKAKMFGIESGTGETSATAVTEVRINIRDRTGPKDEDA
jgi:hypothetical protein